MTSRPVNCLTYSRLLPVMDPLLLLFHHRAIQGEAVLPAEEDERVRKYVNQEGVEEDVTN